MCGGEAQPHPGVVSAEKLQTPHADPPVLSCPVPRSGLPNFLAVALVLQELGYQAVGVRLDSGDLLQQAREIRGVFRTAAAQ